VPLKLQAYAATTFVVRLLRGKHFTVPVRRALRVRFGAAGTRTVCLTIPREPRLWYARRRFRLSIAFGAGAPHLVPIRIRL
jgi:hypothetical protein